MTDRVRHLTITLDRDYRYDDAEAIVSALSMIKGVADIELHAISVTDLLSRATVRSDLEVKLVQAIHQIFHCDPPKER